MLPCPSTPRDGAAAKLSNAAAVGNGAAERPVAAASEVAGNCRAKMEGVTEGDSATVWKSLDLRVQEPPPQREGQYRNDESPRSSRRIGSIPTAATRESRSRGSPRRESPRGSAGYAPPATYVSPYTALPWAHEQAYREIVGKLEQDKATSDRRQAFYSEMYKDVVQRRKQCKGALSTPGPGKDRLSQKSFEESPYRRNPSTPQQQAERLSAIRQRSRESLSPPKGPLLSRSRESLSPSTTRTSSRSRRKQQPEKSRPMSTLEDRSVASQDKLHLHLPQDDAHLFQPLVADANEHEHGTGAGRAQKGDRRSKERSKRNKSDRRFDAIEGGPRSPRPVAAEPSSDKLHQPQSKRRPKVRAKAKPDEASLPEWHDELQKGAQRIDALDQQLALLRSSHASTPNMSNKMPSISSNLSAYVVPHAAADRRQTYQSARRPSRRKQRDSACAGRNTPDTTLPPLQAHSVPLDAASFAANTWGPGKAREASARGADRTSLPSFALLYGSPPGGQGRAKSKHARGHARKQAWSEPCKVLSHL